MGKGLSQRRRLKNATNANAGNLHKAALGKVGGSKYTPLPEAPKKEELVDRVPKSLQKMLKMKASDERKKNQRQQRSSNNQASDGPGQGKQLQPKSAGSTQQRGSAAAATAGGKPVPAQQAAAQEGQDDERRSSGPDTRGLDPDAGAAGAKKTKKRDYLRHKKEKKKGKVDKDAPTLLEQQLKQGGKVRFGERSDAPLEVNLKRKHWSKLQEKTASERCKDIFLKQMGEAKRKDEALRRGVPETAGSAGSLGTANKKRKVDPVQDKEQLRLQVIEAYRSQKRSASAANGATMSSLAKLVKKGTSSASHVLD